jgi:hypothetical protein
MISDSGCRRSFASGAVRDIQEGKGRPTLMPLGVAARVLDPNNILNLIHTFWTTRDTIHLYTALKTFASVAYGGSVETMLLEVSIHYEEGCRKYGENNWQKGIPVDCYMDSAIRHYLKWRRGDDDEPHDRAFVWNIMCCIWEVDYHD